MNSSSNLLLPSKIKCLSRKFSKHLNTRFITTKGSERPKKNKNVAYMRDTFADSAPALRSSTKFGCRISTLTKGFVLSLVIRKKLKTNR